MTEQVQEAADSAAPAPEAKETKKGKPKQTAEEKAALAAEKARLKAEAKAKADAEKAAKEATAKAKDTKNGVTRPMQGVTKMVWDAADYLSQRAGAPTERAKVVEALKGKVEVGTVHTQFGRWKKYYSLTESKEERQKRLEAARAKKTEQAAIKKAEKEAAKAKADAEKAAKEAAQAAADAKKAEEAAAAA